ncbi:hypothetical protein F4805DRAFT_461272 [Annulohypoxylon moriforme]|nr:hypothetical protein F4805DRAFT_461272 [Annulohypoxylon moriforme]
MTGVNAEVPIPGGAPNSDPHGISTNGTAEIHQRWEDAMNHCKKVLGEDNFTYIMKFESPVMMMAEVEKLIVKTKDSSVPRLLRQLKPHLDQITTFVFSVFVTLNLPSIPSICLWGLITFMLQRAEKSEELLCLITEMWSDISINLSIFEVYKAHIAEDQALGLILFEVLEELQKFAFFTTKTLEYARSGNYIKEKVAAQQLTRGQQMQRAEAINLIRQERIGGLPKDIPLTIDPLALDEAKLPGFYFPFPRNPVFCGREKLLDAIRESLKSRTTEDYIPSVALWAPAGMGKTQVALEYAYRVRDEGMKAIFWIDAEHESEWTKAFTEIANLLNLVGATSSKGHEANRLLVLRWLQETATPWLVVFDNVEDQRVLGRIWPLSGPGCILVTCRSELTAASCSRLTMEVPAFDDNEGGTMLRSELQLGDEDVKNNVSSKELSSLLGGHAITLNVMARSVIARKKTLQEFVKMYEEDPRSLHKKPKRRIHNLYNQYYDKPDDLESIWSIPFSQIRKEESRLLGILAMFGPSKVPSFVFTMVTLGLEQSEIEEAALGLRSLALMQANHDGSLYSVHRLIQGEYRNYIGIHEQSVHWTDAANALSEVFPKQHKGSTMFNQWQLCESLIEHVEALSKCYRELSGRTKIPYLEAFSYLMSDAGRYLAEIGRYNACVALLNCGFDHCKDDDSIVFANLSTIMGQVYCERGQDIAALKHTNAVLRVRESQLDHMHSEVANALSNSALSMVGCGQNLEEALEMLDRSLKIDLANPREDHTNVLHLRYLNTAFALRALGRFHEAIYHVEEANKWAIAEFGESSRYLTISYRINADVAMRRGDYDKALKDTEEALRIARLTGSTTPWVAAALYYLGDIKIKQNDPKQAIEFLRECRVISEICRVEKTDDGEVARAMKKLAEAYAANGETDRSEALKSESESMYSELLQSGKYTQSDNERDKWDYLISLKFR